MKSKDMSKNASASDYEMGIRRFYVNEWGDLRVQISTVKHDKKDRHDLMNLWLRRGHVDKFIPTTLSVETEFMMSNGDLVRKFNPTVKIEIEKQDLGDGVIKDYSRRVLDFDWVLEATPENEQKILDEIERCWEEYMSKEEI